MFQRWHASNTCISKGFYFMLFQHAHILQLTCKDTHISWVVYNTFPMKRATHYNVLLPPLFWHIEITKSYIFILHGCLWARRKTRGVLCVLDIRTYNFSTFAPSAWKKYVLMFFCLKSPVRSACNLFLTEEQKNIRLRDLCAFCVNHFYCLSYFREREPKVAQVIHPYLYFREHESHELHESPCG